MAKPRAPRPKRSQPDIVRSALPLPVDPRQSDLFHDPMPGTVEPQLATLAPKLPTGEFWAYEIKWDGYRLAIHVAHGKAKMITRGGNDWTHRFPSIIAAAERRGAGRDRRGARSRGPGLSYTPHHDEGC
jgi:bifunctional non-homologous end joining protein LigD